ncbi:M6 family metalloprotease domain-containing protein [Streptomyces sp. NRRL WC-3618]|uniref:M6 family metalloprotease domain-containing protein n=1 Tax=Streptomyces sp. NRRL WC-3618 TaxID=1519490 RepID=UPI0006AFB62D|nr:M6 family metalloprotease domain-containing protein [Streptomyces sp. NRRL WC-3618]
MVDLSAARDSAVAVWSEFCAIAPSPELRGRMLEELERVRGESDVASTFRLGGTPRRLGFDDGTIIPADEFPLGTPHEAIRTAAASRAPLTGAIRVVVVLADFEDKPMTQDKEHFEKLFFSLGELPNGSVRDYYREVTHGLVDIVGEVIGPVRLPQKLSWYANNNYGIGRPTGEARAQIMARDAAVGADPLINYAPYDNDGNGMVDAFMVLHSGPGGEATGNRGDIWSHKWVLPSAYNADGARIFGYLTIPEDAKIGVCAHELGHLLFGFPDLYDVDWSSEGVGNWCLMGGGSWGGGGDIPTHPSAWCKIQQGWAKPVNVTSNGTLSIPDVKSGFEVFRLWTEGLPGNEYFLVENRQQTGYDRSLPAAGALFWHVDESQPDNTNENHYKVGLVQADNRRDLEWATNRGDDGDPYPGSTGNSSFSPSSKPSSASYAGAATGVSVTDISAPAPTMTATVSVSAAGAVRAPVRAMVGRGRETESVPGLVNAIHELQERLTALEETVVPWAGPEVFLEQGLAELRGTTGGSQPLAKAAAAQGTPRHDGPYHR